MSIQVDLTSIDLAALIEQETPAARFGRAYGHGAKRTQKSTCPWCGGTDRFAVVDSEPPHFYCGIHGGQGCGKHGDAIAFMRQWHGISFTEACARLGVTPEKDGQPVSTSTSRVKRFHLNIDSKPGEDWRMAAEYFVARCQQWLWKDTGQEALQELRQRGFSDETIRQRGYGYNPKTLFDKDIARWGVTDENVKAIWLPRGIVIPWLVTGELWKVNIRRPAADMVEEEARTGHTANKYVNVKGGSNPIYRADTIQPGKPLVLFEGEFNADILAQALKVAGITDIAVVATGSTGKGRADNWLMKIAKASPILISFDADAAGTKATEAYWAKVLPEALVWPSTGGDMNDMYLAGKDVLKWLTRGLKIAGSEVIAPEALVEVEASKDTDTKVSTVNVLGHSPYRVEDMTPPPSPSPSPSPALTPPPVERTAAEDVHTADTTISHIRNRLVAGGKLEVFWRVTEPYGYVPRAEYLRRLHEASHSTSPSVRYSADVEIEYRLAH